MSHHRRADRTLVADLDKHLDSRVRVCGWAHRVDVSGCDPVVELEDHTGRVPLLVGDGPPPTTVEDLTPGSAVEAVGTVERDGGGPRVVVDRLSVSGRAQPGIPVTAASPLKDRLDWRYLDLRHPRNRLVFEVQTTAERAMRSFWTDHGFLEIHSPKLRPTPTRSGRLFPVGYFDRRAYLVQSPQFYKQMAMAAGFDRVFEIGPVFRAQAEPTDRHDTEFTSIDVEMSWIDSCEDLLTHQEELLCRVLTAVGEAHGGEIHRRFGTAVRIPSRPFPRVTLEDAKSIVAGTGWPAGPRDEDLDEEGERRLAAHVAAEHGHEFVFVTDYPEGSRPFYHMRRTDDPVVTHSFDLLWRGLEITSGAQREHRYERLVDQARSRGVPVDLVRGYLDFFRYGCPPHGGFGLGLTRMLVSMLGLADVREVTYLFRGPRRLTP